MSIDQNLSDFETIRRGELLLCRRQLIRLQDEARLLRRDLQRKYNPNQPRVPTGGAGGGQWTSGAGGGGGGGGFGLGGAPGLAEFSPEGETVFDTSGDEAWSSYDEGWSDDGAVFERDVTNRDGSTIQSEYAASREAGFDERHTVTLNSGEKVAFETTDRTQTIRFGGPDGEVISRTAWTPNGPEPDATVQPAFAGQIAGRSAVAAGSILFGWLSPQNGIDGQQAVMGFNARDYQPRESSRLDLGLVGQITREEAEAACRYLPEMQWRLDDAVASAGSISDYPSPTVYGTYIHQRLKDQIVAANYLDLHAERSFSKEMAEIGLNKEVPYGYPASIRIDAIEYRADGTVCVYDFKTGKTTMSARRFETLARAGYFRDKNINRAIVIEVRPKR